MPVSASFHGMPSNRSSGIQMRGPSAANPRPSELTAFSTRQSGLGDDDSAMFYQKKMLDLQTENDKLRQRLADQQADLEEFERMQAKQQMEGERQAQMDKFMGKGAKGKGKAPAPIVEEEEEPPAVNARTSVGSKRDSTASKAAKVDMRKVLEDFKRPLDDTNAILSEFVTGHNVPIVVAIAQAEAMQESMRSLQAGVVSIGGRMDALKARSQKELQAGGSQAARMKMRRYNDALEALKGEQRRFENEIGGLSDLFSAHRDAVLQRTSTELDKALTAYDKAREDVVKARGEDVALIKIGELCAPLSAEALAEREEPLPRQPAEIGNPTQVRTLLFLAERAAAAVKAEGPLDRLAKELVGQAGPGCTLELGATKGFRRALQKAHLECGGDYLLLNDMARCAIVCPKLSTLAEGLRWLLQDAKTWAVDDPELPSFEPLQIIDTLSANVDAEGMGAVRQVVVIGKMVSDGGQNVNVEIQLHIKRLFEAKKKLSILYDGRRTLGALDDGVALHEGELSKGAIDRASKGLVMRLECPNGDEAPSTGTRDALIAMLQTVPCALNELNLTGSVGWQGVDIADGLLLPPGGAPLACTRLRVLKLARLKLGGEIPKALARCTWLRILELQDNWLRGPVPDTLGKCLCLETLALHGNVLSGEVPAMPLSVLSQLTMLTLGGELGGNDELTITSAGKAAITNALAEQAELYLPKPPSGPKKIKKKPLAFGEKAERDANWVDPMEVKNLMLKRLSQSQPPPSDLHRGEEEEKIFVDPLEMRKKAEGASGGWGGGSSSGGWGDAEEPPKPAPKPKRKVAKAKEWPPKPSADDDDDSD